MCFAALHLFTIVTASVHRARGMQRAVTLRTSVVVHALSHKLFYGFHRHSHGFFFYAALATYDSSNSQGGAQQHPNLLPPHNPSRRIHSCVNVYADTRRPVACLPELVLNTGKSPGRLTSGCPTAPAACPESK